MIGRREVGCRGAWVHALVVVALGMEAGLARADEVHHQSLLVGERALGLGGAFTGLADGASAAYYNPAGLAQLRSSTISGSLTLNSFDQQTIEGGYGTPTGTADLVHEAEPAFPVFVGVVKKLGPKDDEGMRSHAVALSTAYPDQRRYSYLVDIRNDEVMVDRTLKVDHEDRTTLYGPSYAYRFSDVFALGISVFLATRELEHEEDEVVITRGMQTPEGFFVNPTIFTRENLVALSAQSIVIRVGGLYDLTENLRVGVMFQPPGILLDAESRVRGRDVFADLIADPASATFFFSDQSDLDAESPIPWELRVGASFGTADFTVAADVSVHGPNGSASDPVRQIGDPAPDQATGTPPFPGVFVLSSFHRELTVNGALGFETNIADLVPIRAGVFTDLSAAPEITGPTDAYAPSDIDHFGASLSVGITSGDYDISIGAAGLYGKGTALALNPEAGSETQPETYIPRDAEDRVLFFFLSGAKRAASRFASEMYNEHLRPD